jgi:hypothetical protein
MNSNTNLLTQFVTHNISITNKNITMTPHTNLLSRLTDLHDAVILDNFYSVNIWTNSQQISMQGHLNESNASAARKLGIDLTYDNERAMLIGESADGKLRICLT